MKIESSFPLIVCLILAGCSGPASRSDNDASLPANIPKPRPTRVEAVSVRQAEDLSLRALLAFYQSSQKLSTSEQARLRSKLAAQAQDAPILVQQAILLGNDGGNVELGRALGLLESVQRSVDADAIALQPLVRVLVDQYAERLKLGVQADKLGQIARESQRRAEQLQEKLDALAAIERSLPTRPVTPLPSMSPEKTQ